MERLSPKQMSKKLVRILKKETPDYFYLKKVFEHIRNDLGLKRESVVSKKLPEVLTDQELMLFYDTVWHASNRVHVVMIKVLLYTGVRNAELADITLKDVDLKGLTIRITQGKGKKDRYVPFPIFFRGELAQYIENQNARRAKYLFETNRLEKFTTRWIREIVKRYALKAGINKRIYPHLFRHQLLTYLTNKGIIDAKVQQISGHKDRKSLEIYQNITLKDVSFDYQKAMNDFPVK